MSWSTETGPTDDIQQILTEIIPAPNSPLSWLCLPITVEKLDKMPGSSVIQNVIVERICKRC
jgi:hypothetical protein